MLKVAVPNKGSLSESAIHILSEAGYRQRRSSRDLAMIDTENDVEFFYLRPRDIAVYVGEGTLDLGITGRDLLLDSGAQSTEVMQLGFGQSRFHFAAPTGAMTGIDDLVGKRVATSYTRIVEDYLAAHRIEATVVLLDGAVESSVRLGVADAIADVIQTGSTMRQAGLEIIGEPILSSEAVLIERRNGRDAAGLEVFQRRIQGVLVARTYVMMDYDIRVEEVDRAVSLTPGVESPTVSPLHREGWVAVRSMVLRDRAQSVMDELWKLGARGILVTEILACRL